ncbi:hypothetical protein [Methylophaga pinxianii]|uniref:hypothetical protein n=1 Tax=Methylophaga pinxianii TaxID=2881052 RepID=UPI001CF41C42|nr:hypothetical protein [Methylophaga pinxianii]MCB2427696.1 hypothetical protein [Methylophaga pinxianii]UPH46199.1 hypothetical protein LGT42_002645 [Methylophaga pinxianii]
MKRQTILVLLVLLGFGYAAFQAVIYYTKGMDYQSLSSKSSPDNRYLITEFLSMTEVSQAPYGLHLVLSTAPVKLPEDGQVIFAGYCDHFFYEWYSNQQISISCDGYDEHQLMSRSVKAYGIDIHFN